MDLRQFADFALTLDEGRPLIADAENSDCRFRVFNAGLENLNSGLISKAQFDEIYSEYGDEGFFIKNCKDAFGEAGFDEFMETLLAR